MTLWSFWAQKEQKWEGKSAYGPLLLVGLWSPATGGTKYPSA